MDRKKKKVVVNLMKILAKEGESALMALADILVKRSKNSGYLKVLTQKMQERYAISELENEEPETAFMEGYSRVLITPYTHFEATN